VADFASESMADFNRIHHMWPAIRFRKNDFPIDFQRLASAGC
jgi:hypothetical protein